MDKLQEFHFDKEMMETVKAFIVSVLEDEAVSRVMNKEDISGLADAKSVLLKSFDRLDEIYNVEKDKESVNQSR